MKKSKNVAGFLALFFGWLGIHRFYLEQNTRGVFYIIFCWFPLIWIIGFIDAIAFFSMDEQQFDRKYNKHENSGDTDFERPVGRRYAQRQTPPPKPAYRTGQPKKDNLSKASFYRKAGLEKFKDYDYSGAIEDFEKSLELEPRDIATHFNLACTYSLTENVEGAFKHLDRAVTLGFKDFKKIKEHHALAYLRIQKQFEEFQENGYRLSQKSWKKTDEENLLDTKPDLLDQLKKLGDLRDKGLLTEQEFADQKKKLLG